MRNIPNIQKYLPDTVKLESLSRELLINVRILFVIYNFLIDLQIIEVSSPQTCLDMYNEYKNRIGTKTFPRWVNYGINMTVNFSQVLSQRVLAVE